MITEGRSNHLSLCVVCYIKQQPLVATVCYYPMCELSFETWSDTLSGHDKV